MSLIIWVVSFFLWSLFCCWVIKGGGAIWLKESWFSWLIFWWVEKDAPADIIKEVVKLVFIGTSLLFLAGLFSENIRKVFVFPTSFDYLAR